MTEKRDRFSISKAGIHFYTRWATYSFSWRCRWTWTPEFRRWSLYWGCFWFEKREWASEWGKREAEDRCLIFEALLEQLARPENADVPAEAKRLSAESTKEMKEQARRIAQQVEDTDESSVDVQAWAERLARDVTRD